MHTCKCKSFYISKTIYKQQSNFKVIRPLTAFSGENDGRKKLKENTAKERTKLAILVVLTTIIQRNKFACFVS